jgi:serine/threonine protein kinase
MSSALDETLKAYLQQADALPEQFKLAKEVYTPVAPGRAGTKAVVWRVKDEKGVERAAKLSVYEGEYETKSYLHELSLAAPLDPYTEFARPLDAGYLELNVPTVRKFICFIEKWVEGETLQTLIDISDETLTPSFLLAYARQFCNILSILEAHQLRHDDLRAKNVIISPPRKGVLSAESQVVVVDCGSLKKIDVPLHKETDDHGRFVQHLVDIRNVIYRKKRSNVMERLFLSEVDLVLTSMVDPDPVRALRDPKQIKEALERAYSIACGPKSSSPAKLNTPFEFISAEHIADDRVLEQIFARSCPWLAKVEGPDPCLVTGPRGCGKSTIFRWLSLKTHLHKTSSELKNLKLTGFYISCSIDLQNRLGWITSEHLADTHKGAIVHYFNLVATREILQTLIRLQIRPDAKVHWGFGPTQEDKVHAFIVNALSSSRPRLQGVPKLVQALEMVESEMYTTHSAMLRGIDPTGLYTPETYLGDFSTLLVNLVPEFQRRRITFLVDDFSTHRIPEHVQRILNTIIWERRSSHVFKLSSEKHGAVLVNTRNASADLTREMNEIDCGKEYILLEESRSKETKAFALELLNNRLKAAGYEGTAQGLLGKSSWAAGSLAKALCTPRKGRGEDHYHGTDVIALLCSGDVSSLLYVYRQIFEQAGVTTTTVNEVAKAIQSKAIKEVSRKMTEAVKLTQPNGPECYKILIAFGELVKKILKEGKQYQDPKTGAMTPTQAPRIELDRSANDEPLPPVLHSLERELLRRAVFIDLDIGSSRHAFQSTIRWHLRRIYLPTFSAALNKNNAVKKSYDWLKYLLTSPEDACNLVWLSWPRPAHSKKGNRRDNREPQGVIPYDEAPDN